MEQLRDEIMCPIYTELYNLLRFLRSSRRGRQRTPVDRTATKERRMRCDHHLRQTSFNALDMPRV